MKTVSIRVRVDPMYADAEKVAAVMEDAAVACGAVVMQKTIKRDA